MGVGEGGKEDYLVKEKKGVKLTRHDKLLNKFRRKEALVEWNVECGMWNVVAVMEKAGELGLLLGFLQRCCTVLRYSGSGDER
uniref:Uncharacterized protein n=1 Tax=Noccaea caerulescens TaxID=107243 RepID=A0A1J3J424_NOCCA